jgi:hypothetical protein
MNINIRPDPIIAAGNTMTELSEVVTSTVTEDLAPNRTAATSHPGWESSAALVQATQVWENKIGNLAFQLGQLGDRLEESANSYVQTEAEALRRIQEVFSLLGSS